MFKDIIGQIKEVNKLYHARTCQKFPSLKNIIAQPLTAKGKDKDKILKERETVLRKVRAVMVDKEQIKAINASIPLGEGITRANTKN